MSEYADKHSKASRKERVDRILQVDPKAKIDASGYTPPGPMDTGKKTEQAQERPTRKSGGRLDGESAHKHAGRKSRDAGGVTKSPEMHEAAREARWRAAKAQADTATARADQSAWSRRQVNKKPLVDTRGDWKRGGRAHRDSGGAASVINQLRPQVPTGGLYGNGFSPTHAGMMSTAAGLKKGGMAKKRASGGEAVQQARANRSYQNAKDAEGNANFFTAPFKEQDTQSAMDRMNDSSSKTGYDAQYKRGGSAKKRASGGAVQRTDGTSRAEWRKEKQHSDIAGKEATLPKSNPVMASTGTRETGGRQPRADGGRTKGKTNINIIIGGPKEMPAGGPMAPPPPSAMPPKPPLPPAAMGGPAAPPGMPPGMPPQMPPGMGPK